MQASDVKLGKVLSTSQVFHIPLFQRPYVWQRDRNWQPLWEDVRRVAEAVEAEHSALGDDAGSYFLGAIVTQERRRSPQRLSSMNLIDGQQRLTTLQVLIAAACSVAAKHGCDSVAGRLEDLVTNNERAVSPQFPDDRLKVLPLPQDREAYRWAVRRPDSELSRPTERKQLALAREWFETQIAEWTIADGVDPSRRLDALQFALDDRVQIVHIILDPNEDPQVIFEVLNGRGEPLLPADLIKNLLFQTVEIEGDHSVADELLLAEWLPFDSAPWRESVTTGRITRAQIDVFLAYWLTAKTGREVPVEHLFISFKKWLQGCGLRAAQVMKDLRRDGDRYLELKALDTSSALGALIDAMEATQTSTPWPVLLHLRNRDDVPDSELQVAAAAIDSFTMRRTICGLTTKDYNRLFLQVLAVCKESSGIAAGKAVRETLAAQTADSRAWPSDSAFRALLVGPGLYTRLTKPKLRALLVGLENHLRSRLSEDLGRVAARDGNLTIEHLLPRSWQTHWAVPGDDPDAQFAREDSVHRLGNLTLLTSSLNPRVGNSGWAAKSADLRRHTLLRLTTSSVFAVPLTAEGEFTDRQWSETWDETRIRYRSLWLADVAVAAWSRPPGGTEVDWSEQTEVRRGGGGRRVAGSLGDLVRAGILVAGDELVWVRPQVGERHACVVQEDGNLRMPDGSTRASPTDAANALAGGSHNGWMVWRVPNRDGRQLGELRSLLPVEPGSP